MNSIIVICWALCLVQVTSSIRNYNKIFRDEFGSQDLVQKKGVHALKLLERNKRASPQKSYVLFDNRSGRQVELWWNEIGKQKELYMTMESGKALPIDTYTVHQWSANVKITKEELLIGNKSIYTPQENTPESRDIFIIRRQGQKDVEIGEKFIEIMVVVDKAVKAYHNSTKNVRRYVLLLLKLASRILQHPSLSQNFGVKITLVLSELVILEEDKKEIMIQEYSSLRDSVKNLNTVCRYMNKIGNSGPRKFDHKLFLTRIKFGYSGFGNRFQMCSQRRSCSLILDCGFSSAVVIAHEIGHLLGTNDKYFGADSINVMAQPITARLNKHTWSHESKVLVMSNIKDFRCLDNRPVMDNVTFPVLHKYPGVYYPAVAQCELEYTKNHSHWKASDPCKELKCQLPPPYSLFFYRTKSPALDGTECGANKWCLNGSCQTRLPIDVIPTLNFASDSPFSPQPTDGKWGVWKAWTPCSKTCGDGIQTRRRECNNPKPSDGGTYCVGGSTEIRVCEMKNCLDKMLELCVKEGNKHQSRKWGIYDVKKVNLDCDFENDTCNWKNQTHDDEQDWQLNKGNTPSSGTGPKTDHTKKTEHGQYIYFESTSLSKGDKARLSSPDLAVPQACLTFWYHMYGRQGMGSLRVMKHSHGISQRLWRKTGNQGSEWLQGQVEINDDNLYKIAFVAKNNFISYQSDIALDSITFTPGPCQKTSEVQINDIRERCSVTCTTIDKKSPKKIIRIPRNDGTSQGNCNNLGCDGVPRSGKKYDSCKVCGGDGTSCFAMTALVRAQPRSVNIDCDFEDDLCTWTIEKKSTNHLYWLRRKGLSGHYMFMETFDEQNRGKYVAKLVSPNLRNQKACLTFDYRMNGKNITKLRVRQINRVATTSKWVRKGDQGNGWLKATVDINGNSILPYKILIEAIVGNRRHGTIAVDNMKLREGSCS